MADGVFVQLLLHQELVPTDALREAQRDQRREDPSRPLGWLLLERGLLDERQLTAVLAQQREILISRRDRRHGLSVRLPDHKLTRSEEEQLFRARVVELGLVEPAAVEAAMTEIAARRAQGDRTHLLRLLVDQELISAHQLRLMRRQVRRPQVICFSCKRKIAYQGAEPPAVCSHCGADFPRDPHFASGAWMVANWPQHAADKQLAKMLRKNKLLDAERIDLCKKTQKTSFPSRDLGKVLLEHGFLTMNQLYRLYRARQDKMRGKFPNLEAQRRDVRLGRVLVNNQFASLAKVNDALLEQVGIEKDSGAHRPLLDIVAERDLVTLVQARDRIPELFSRVTETEHDGHFDLERVLIEAHPNEDLEMDFDEDSAFGLEPTDELPDVDFIFESFAD